MPWVMGRRGDLVWGGALLLLLLLLPLAIGVSRAQDGGLAGGRGPDAGNLERWLDDRRVSLALEDASLAEALWQLSRASGLNLALHPAAAELSRAVTLKLSDVPVRSLLDLLLRLAAPVARGTAGPGGGATALSWRFVDTVILVEPAVFSRSRSSASVDLFGAPAQVQVLLDRRVSVRFEKTPAEEAVGFLRKTASIPIVIDGLLLTHWRTSNSAITLSVRDVEVRALVDLTAALLGLQARWQNSCVTLSLP